MPHSGCTRSNGAMWRSQSLQLSASAPRSGPVAPVVSSFLFLHDAVLQQDQPSVLFPGSGITLLLPVQHQGGTEQHRAVLGLVLARRSGPTAWKSLKTYCQLSSNPNSDSQQGLLLTNVCSFCLSTSIAGAKGRAVYPL